MDADSDADSGADSARLRVALGQFTAAAGDVATNLAQLETMLASGARAGADLVCFPELCLPGYLLDPSRYSEDLLSELANADGAIAAVSRELGVRVMYGTAMTWDGDLHNTVVLVDPDGRQTRYAKAHVPVLERAMFTAGDDLVLTADGDLALACCYDLAFPEFCAGLADAGARALFFPMAWERQRAFVFEGLVAARAIENVAYVVCVNQTGSMQDIHYYGRSRIIDPLGAVVVEMADEVGLVTADLDLGWVSRLRSPTETATYPLLADRRPRLAVALGTSSDHKVANRAEEQR
jgi:predicted amidohydrolase